MNLIKRLYKENIFYRLFVKIMIGLAALYILSILLLFLFQDNLIFYPQKLSQAAFANIKESAVENIELKVDKTETIRGWFCKNDTHQKQKLILYFGGNAEEVSYLVRESTEIKGWSVALTNYRGYGMSDGKPSEKDLFCDALRIYDYYANRPDIDTDHIVIMGRSLGTGIATYLASQRKAKGVILISPYDSMTSVGQEKFMIEPVSLILRNRFDSISYAPSIKAPLLAIWGSIDTTIPPKHSKVLVKKWGGKVETNELPGLDHNDLIGDGRVWNLINDFLKSKTISGYSPEEVMKQIALILPDGSEILNPKGMNGKKYIEADLDRDNITEAIACYRDGLNNIENGIVIIKEGIWSKMWVDPIYLDTNLTIDNLTVLNDNTDGFRGLLVNWAETNTSRREIYAWENYSLHDIFKNVYGSIIPGDYSKFVLDNKNGKTVGILIKHSNSDFYNSYQFDESKLTLPILKRHLSDSQDASADIPARNEKITDFNVLDNTLGVKVEEIAAGLFDDIGSLTIKDVVKTRLYSTEGNDYIVRLFKKSSESHWVDANLLLVFVPDGKKYRLIGTDSEKNLNFQLVDIDSDGKYELLTEKINSHHWDIEEVTLYSYKSGKQTSIFDEGTVWNMKGNAYSYMNNFDFQISKINPKLLDIKFKVNTDFDMESYKTLSAENSLNKPEIFKPFSDDYIFKFDGTKYVPDKLLYDYNKFK